MIGNYVFTCDELGVNVVGFENHSGKTYLGSGVKPMGKVLKGCGNNGADGTEGARYQNVFATYSHGCLLPKNPVLCDYILKTAPGAQIRRLRPAAPPRYFGAERPPVYGRPPASRQPVIDLPLGSP